MTVESLASDSGLSVHADSPENAVTAEAEASIVSAEIIKGLEKTLCVKKDELLCLQRENESLQLALVEQKNESVARIHVLEEEVRHIQREKEVVDTELGVVQGQKLALEARIHT